jgi:DNA-binding SARP family transcriptional activator
MEINILGPLEAHIEDVSLVPSAGKPRQMLALLAMRVGQVVPVSSIIEELWGTEPPRSALTTLQTYVMQLRRLIAQASPAGVAGAKRYLATRYGGYVLNIDSQAIDAVRYQELVEAGNRALGLGDATAAARLLRNALDIWRGLALVDVHQGYHLGVEVAGLNESRLAALEARIEADLRIGHTSGLLSELAGLTARFPLNENLSAQYMIALCRAGRQWQALELFRSFRNALTDELGLEPSARLHNLHRAILNADLAAIDEHLNPEPAFQRSA